MSQHSQRTQYGPSMGTIVTGLSLTLGGGTAVAYILAGPLTARSVVGAVLGAGFTVLIGLQTLERAVERRVALDRIERQAEREEAARREDRLRAEWEHAVYGSGPVPDEAEELERSRERAGAAWSQAYGADPDPVATQPIEPDPLQVEHWATGGAAPEPYAVPVHPLPDGPEPGRYPFHPRPTDQPDWADRDWPTEVMERQG
ncbi:MAG TPA: hypothetical protein VFU47_14960 [Armatimonadota bacterium]|nr:hypothetical protein [Armatimonadota bacterium]